jgi:hypothetical protein
VKTYPSHDGHAMMVMSFAKLGRTVDPVPAVLSKMRAWHKEREG